MSSPDDPGASPKGLGQTNAVASEQVHSQLVEALLLVLIEKGVLTKNDALSVIETVAQVQQGAADEQDELEARASASLAMLQRLYQSFEAISDGQRAPQADNVHQLRPSIYGRPDFPRDD